MQNPTVGSPSGEAGQDGAALGPLANLRYDIPAGLVVFLVALPLCLGIALASGAPMTSGLIAGLAGGLVVPLISSAPLSVSGPAAGLAAVVLTGISSVGTLGAFGVAVILAGVLQALLGLARAGGIAAYFPSSVVKGMLTAIGVLLILKQLPHAIGFDRERFGALSFQGDGENTLSRLGHAFTSIEPGAALISAICLAILVVWDKVPALKRLSWLPGPLAAVATATVLNLVFQSVAPALALEQSHLVQLTPPGAAADAGAGLLDALTLPDWSAVTRKEVWLLAVTLAIVASLETLLNLEAVDRLDPWRRRSPPNRELLAQGAANMVSGLLGGLPVTSVIVRSSANVNAGGRTRAAAFVHGVFLVVAVLFASALLTKIPLACLASILLVTGYKLARPQVFADMARLGFRQLLPFMTTVLAIVFTDLLKGIAIGLAVGLVFVVREAVSEVFDVVHEGSRVTIRFNKAAHFLSRGKLLSVLERVPHDAHVVIDTAAARFIDHDVADALHRFRETAAERNIRVELRGLEPA